MMRDSTLRSFLDITRAAGALVNWHKSEREATLIGDRRFTFKNASDPDLLRGPNIGHFWCDEASLIDAQVWNIMIGRLREPPGHAWATSTPRGKGWLYREFSKQDGRHFKVKAATSSNPYLPSWFLESLIDTYGQTAFARQELFGEEIDDAEDVLLPAAWLSRAFEARHSPQGEARIGVDLAAGGGSGDRSVVLVRDSGGILDIAASRSWDLGQTAAVVARMAATWRVAHDRIVFDRPGPGTDFNHRLKEYGINSAKAYAGGAGGGVKFSNLRTASAWLLRQRMDPFGPGALTSSADGPDRYRGPFAIPSQFSDMLRPELAGLKWAIDRQDRKICLCPKAELTADLGHSPDIADALIISFSYPYA
jgi:hypothetical protein